MRKNLRKVAIVGRMNVGKSTLFNRLSTDVKSITFDYPGVTRDVISDIVSWKGDLFELIDTGGISFKKSTDPLTEQVRQKALEMLGDADLILFVVDGKSGLTIEDRDIVKSLHRVAKPLMLIVNKVDNRLAQEQTHEFYQLGFKKFYTISAIHGLGIADVLDDIIEHLKELPPLPQEEKAKCRVVLLGKPNVGKSSILNALLEYERSLVSDIPGTTREPIAAPISFYKETIELVDTAGVRRKRSVDEDLEKLMVKSTLRAVDNADVVLLVVDVSIGDLSDQEKKLAFYAFEKGKALVLLFNKTDLKTQETDRQLKMSMDEYEFFLKKVEQLQISCKTGENVGKILPLINKIWERYTQEFSIDDLTMLFKTALEKKPLYHKSSLLILRRAEQVKNGPPTIVLRVNEPAWFGPSQLGYFENRLRKKYNLVGVPVIFYTRKKTK